MKDPREVHGTWKTLWSESQTLVTQEDARAHFRQMAVEAGYPAPGQHADRTDKETSRLRFSSQTTESGSRWVIGELELKGDKELDGDDPLTRVSVWYQERSKERQLKQESNPFNVLKTLKGSSPRR